MSLPWLDWLAFGAYAAILLGYSWLIERSPWSKHTWSVQMGRVRRRWFEACLKRQVRMPDALIMGLLTNGTAYFGSASLLGIGAGFTLLTTAEALPAWVGAGASMKALLLMLMFAAAFFQFAWAYRLFNYNAISIGAIPEDVDDPRARMAMLQATALNVLAGQHFNQAIRMFLYTIPLIFWLVSPWALLITTLGLSFIMLRRQFFTKTHLDGLTLAWTIESKD